ncbi:MAG TPA: hypothetical protein VKQ71_10805 [Acidimicrobiales bacterium]|nr:hypothetical protein [Acidimicrobiales bacterium]
MQADGTTKGATSPTSAASQISPIHYEIRFQGHLHARWTAWFDGLIVTSERDGTTLMRGPIVDQAALHGVLRKLADLGLPLLRVTQVGPDQPEVPTTDIR